jgi:hypothetical protein
MPAGAPNEVAPERTAGPSDQVDRAANVPIFAPEYLRCYQGGKLMTEVEWRNCRDPDEMLRFLEGKLDDRKTRLFACACCRRIWDLLTDERSRRAVETSERYAEGLAKRKDLDASRRSALEVKEIRSDTAPAEFAATSAARPQVAARWVALLTRNAARRASRSEEMESDAQVRLLHEVVGDPFEPVTIDPAWLRWNGSAIVKIAQAIHRERRYSELPILADALEEAGCTKAAVLGHCREPGEHVPGCWIVDLILSKDR